MRTDALLSFVSLGSPLSLIGADGVAIPSTVIDLLGLGVGVAAVNGTGVIYGNTSVFGQADAMGVGGIRPELNVSVGTALVTGNAATLNVALQGAIDDGTGNPSTYHTFGESGALTAAQCAANTVIFRSPWLPPFPENLRPRFLRLLFSPASATHFTAGTIASALVVPSRDDWFQRYAAKNYAVA